MIAPFAAIRTAITLCPLIPEVLSTGIFEEVQGFLRIPFDYFLERVVTDKQLTISHDKVFQSFNTLQRTFRGLKGLAQLENES